MASTKKGGGKQEFVAVLKVPLAEKKSAPKGRYMVEDLLEGSPSSGEPLTNTTAGGGGTGNGGNGPTLSISPKAANVVSGQPLSIDVEESLVTGHRIRTLPEIRVLVGSPHRVQSTSALTAQG